MAGRPPVPTAIKRIRGDPGRYALNEDEPKPTRGVPEAPEHLSELAQKASGRDLVARIGQELSKIKGLG